MTRGRIGIAAAAGIAVGVIVGLALAGFAPGAEAAPKDRRESGGRLIELGTVTNVGPGEAFTTPFVATDDCEQIRGMFSTVPEVHISIQRVRTSPDGAVVIYAGTDGVLTFPRPLETISGETHPESSSLVLVASGTAGSPWTPASFPYVQFLMANSDSQAADVTAWIWCSFH